jgi:hypothetical protein
MYTEHVHAQYTLKRFNWRLELKAGFAIHTYNAHVLYITSVRP